MSWRIIEGDCRDILATLPERSVHTVVTSPPYFGLRDYGTDGQIGLEPSPDEFVAALVAMFRVVRRVLRDDGTVWLNLGDSYAAGGMGGHATSESFHGHNGRRALTTAKKPPPGHKPKDLLGIPWMVAFALRADGWYLRSDIIWAKPNPMPESVTDRPTKSHEYLFLLSKGPRYFYDADAIREENSPLTVAVHDYKQQSDGHKRGDHGGHAGDLGINGAAREMNGRNKRSVWTVTTQPYAGAHFATFPPKLIEPCILAGAPERACGECGAPWERIQQLTAADGRTITRAANVRAGVDDTGQALNADNAIDRNNRGSFTAKRGVLHRETLGFNPSCTHDAPAVPGVVLDPFAGAGTTGVVALRHSRSFVGVELNPEYADMARWRIRDDAPLLNQPAETDAVART